MKKSIFLFIALATFLSSCTKSSFFKAGTYEIKSFSYDYNINFDNGGMITFNEDGTGELVLNTGFDMRFEKVGFTYDVKRNNITFDFDDVTINNYRVKNKGSNNYMIREFGYTIQINDTTFAKPCNMNHISGTWNWNTPDYINYGSNKDDFKNSPSEIGASMRLKMDWSAN
jgi:outer membrane lipoprotein-sorting protein